VFDSRDSAKNYTDACNAPGDCEPDPARFGGFLQDVEQTKRPGTFFTRPIPLYIWPGRKAGSVALWYYLLAVGMVTVLVILLLLPTARSLMGINGEETTPAPRYYHPEGAPAGWLLLDSPMCLTFYTSFVTTWHTQDLNRMLQVENDLVTGGCLKADPKVYPPEATR